MSNDKGTGLGLAMLAESYSCICLGLLEENEGKESLLPSKGGK